MKTDTQLRILATAFDYRPKLGGVATCGYEIVQALGRAPGVEVRLIAPEIQADAGSFQDLPETRRIWLPKDSMSAVLPLSTGLAKEIVSFSPHAVLNFLWLPEAAASLLASPLRWAKKIPYFVISHGVEVIESSSTRRKKWRSRIAPFKNKVFKSAAGVFAVSQFTGRLVETSCEVDPQKIHVIYNGVNPKHFFPGEAATDLVRHFGLEGKQVLLTVARLHDYKGIDRVIASLRFVVAKHPNVLYLVCGEGPDRGRLEAIARHYRVNDHVVFTGEVPTNRLRDYYNLSDAFVLMSRTDFNAPNVEGFGLVFLEAAACAKPSLGGNQGGIPDAVVDGKTGWLVDPTDDVKIAEAILEVLKDPDERKRRGLEGRKRVLEGFTWDHVAERILAVIRKEARSDVRN